MVLIGVYGGSGTGKSTATEMINKKLKNSFKINVDQFMHYYTDIRKDEIIDKLGLNKKDLELEYVLNYCGKSLDSVKKWIKVIEKDIEKEVLEVIKIQEGKVDAIIIDWAFLPLIPLFEQCDFTISINCDLNEKYNRLKKRLENSNKISKWDEENLLYRLKNSALDEFGYTATYKISNNGTLEDLEKNIDSILAENEI